jgi:hypothetical protein
VQQFFEDEYRAALEGNAAERLQYPEYPEPDLGGNWFMKATQLREPIPFAGGTCGALPRKSPTTTSDIG